MTDQASIKKVCVIGAGTMGSGIAAHLANLGFEVTLLDATQQSVTEAFEKAKVSKPPHFMLPETANEIRLGNTTDHLHWLREADWVCEAIVERTSAKRSLFARIEPLIRPDAFISTNTSGIQISVLGEGLSESFRRRLVGTHFFNPPRYLKLLELVPTAETDPEIVTTLTRFLEERVASRVVVAKDTPGFITNRYGMWCMYQAIHVAEKLQLSVEQVDLMTGTFLGRPKSASFRLNDIVGLDVMHDIASNLIERCPQDPYIQTLKSPNSLSVLLERHWIGEKTGRGYYRRQGKEFFSFDLTTLAYRQRMDPLLSSIKELERLPLGQRIAKGLELRDEVGEFLRHYLLPALKYANYLKEEVSHSVLDFDRVMEWGFGWSMGPFAILDAIGSQRIGLDGEKFFIDNSVRQFDGSSLPVPRQPEYIRITETPLLESKQNFNIRDLGDGVKAVSLTTKMGVISPDTVEELISLLESQTLDRFVLTSEARSFSAGFDLNFFAKAIPEERWADIDHALARLQRLGELLQSSKVVAAIYGHVLGAGLEVSLSCPKIVALAETQIGLPESKVGLLPAGRGVTLMRLLNQQSAKRLAEVTLTLAIGQVATNSQEARVLGYLRSTDTTVFHPDRLLFEAKNAALTVEPKPLPDLQTMIGPLSGMIDRNMETAVQKGDFSSHDELIGQKLKAIFSKATSYQECVTKERTEFIDLCTKALTVARINHMLENGKPLRN